MILILVAVILAAVFFELFLGWLEVHLKRREENNRLRRTRTLYGYDEEGDNENV